MSPLFKRKNILLICFFIIIQCNNDLKERDNNKDIILLDEEYSHINDKKNNVDIYSHIKELNQLNNLDVNNKNILLEYKNVNIKIIIIYFTCYGFLFISFISIILLFFDYRENKKIALQYNFSANQKVNDEYKKLKNTYITRGTLLFSLFIMKYIYPLANIINMYNYDYPRYLRFVICIIRFLFITLLTINVGGSFYIKYVEKNNEPEIYIYIIFIILPVLVFLISHIISDLVIRYLLDFVIKRRNNIKPKLENLRQYVYYTIKKDVLFNSKWHALRNRMLTYFRICGKSILIKKKIDKYGKYVNNKLNNKGNLPENINNSINQEDDKDFNGNGLSERLLPPQNYSKNIIRESSNSIQNNNDINRNSIRKSNGNSNNNNFCIDKGCEPFSFSRFGINNMKLKTVKKIEDIRNRYIMAKNTKFDDSVDDDANVKTYENLEIEALENYTYISTDEMINKLNNSNTSSNRLHLSIMINIILFILFLLVIIGICFLYLFFKKRKHEEMFYINLIGLFIIDFIIYYLISIYIAIRLPKLYGYKKKNWFNKFIFKLFIEKYIVYFYRIRLLLIKYHKEFEFNAK
jgi:hypothetical protein